MPQLIAHVNCPSDPQFMQVARAFVASMSALAGFSEKESRMITLAIDEACTNVIRHTYKFETHHRIVLTAAISETALEFRLTDFGAKADLGSFRPRDLEDVRPGGLGTYFMRHIMDQIDFRNLDPNGNEARLIKFLKPSRSDAESDAK